jgi:glycosyltransferase 2 family protein
MSIVSTEVTAPVKRRARPGLLLLKIAVTVVAFVFIFSRQPIADLLEAVRAISPTAFALATLLQYAALTIGTLRWRILMRAYGATHIPTFGKLFKVYVVGYFYNTYLPGAVGGDVMRGVVTRRAFEDSGATGAMAVVLVERALGLAGVFALTGIAISLHAGTRFGQLLPYSVLGLVGVAACVTGLALGKHIARFFPRPIARTLASLPSLVGYGSFITAALMSLLTHTVVAVIGHVLISSILPSMPMADSFVAMPLAAAAGFFPLTVAGAGARDYVLIQLYEAFGAPMAAGTATALAFLLSSLIASGVGGVIQLVSPLDLSTEADET